MDEEGPDSQDVMEKKMRDPEPSRGRLEQTLKKDETEPEEEKGNVWRGSGGGDCQGPAH